MEIKCDADVAVMVTLQQIFDSGMTGQSTTSTPRKFYARVYAYVQPNYMNDTGIALYSWSS